jgi:hypothetical protein
MAMAPSALPALADNDADSAATVVTNAPDDNPYSVIVHRNIFHLNPIPPPPDPNKDKEKEQLPVVKITGFLNIGDSSKALFVAEAKNKSDDKNYYCLSEGETSSDGKLQLLKILPDQTGVNVMNEGVLATLTVKDDSLGASTAPATPAPPQNENRPQPGMPGRRMFVPGRGVVPGVPGIPGFPGGANLPARMRRGPMQPARPQGDE